MKKIFISISTVVVVGLGSAFFSHSVQAETINELETEQSNIKSERKDVKEDLLNAEAEIADVLFDLKEMNEEIEKTDKALEENESMMKNTKKDINESEEEIETLHEEIEALEDAIDVRNELLKSRIASMQKSGGNVGFLEVLFGSKSFDDFVSRASAASKVTSADSDLIEQQEKDKGKVDKQRTTQENKLDEQTELKVELEGMEDLIVSQRKENKSSKKKLKKKEKELVTLKADLEIKDSSLASLESQIRDDIEAARTPDPVVTASQPTNNESTNSSDSDGELTTLSKTNDKPTNKKEKKEEKKEEEKEEKKEEKKKKKESTPESNGTSGGLDTIINASQPHMGTPYSWGGTTPSGFDCSGYVSWAYGQTGKSIPSSTTALQNTGAQVSYSSIQPGDLVFFDTYKTNGHVGIYVGNGSFIGAQNSTGLAVANMESGYWKQHFSGHVRRLP